MLRECFAILIFTVRGIKFRKFYYCPIHLLVHKIELVADNEMEAREKLCRISNSLKVLQDGRAGLVPCVKNFTCKINFMNFNLVVQPQPQKLPKFVGLENFPSYGILLRYITEFSCHPRGNLCM